MRAFLHIRINFPAGNHPCEKNHKNRDEFPDRKSSLQELFCISGSISSTEIIPTGHFLQFRINFPAGNHPCKSFFAIQDQFPRRKSSLQELSCNSGCISPTEIIPARAFSQIRINFPAGNHPCRTFSANQDAMTFSRCPRRFQPFRPREENPSSFSAGKYPPGDFPALQTAAARRQACIPTPDNPSRPDLSV